MLYVSLSISLVSSSIDDSIEVLEEYSRSPQRPSRSDMDVGPKPRVTSRNTSNRKRKRKKRKRKLQYSSDNSLSSSAFLTPISEGDDVKDSSAQRESNEMDHPIKRKPKAKKRKKKISESPILLESDAVLKEKAKPVELFRAEEKEWSEDNSAISADSARKTFLKNKISPNKSKDSITTQTSGSKSSFANSSPPQRYFQQDVLNRQPYRTHPTPPFSSRPSQRKNHPTYVVNAATVNQARNTATINQTPTTLTKSPPSASTIPTSTPTSTSKSTISPSSSGATTQWIKEYLSSHRRDHLLPVPRDFIVDGFNLQKLQDIVESHAPSAPPGIFKAALRLILDQKPQSQRFTASIDDTSNSPNEHSIFSSQPSSQSSSTSTKHLFSKEVQNIASDILYPLLHSRFVLSPRGLLAVSRAMRQNGAVFGRCPRQFCKGNALLPCGSSDYKVGKSKCMRYCCSCGEVLYMWDSSVDGCAWGSSFCHLLLMVFGKDLYPALLTTHLSASPLTNMIPQSSSSTNRILDDGYPSNDGTSYTAATPAIFGFRVHPSEAPVRYPISKRVLLYNRQKSHSSHENSAS